MGEPGAGVLLTSVDVRGFRSARSVSFQPGAMSALVGEANAGKSNLIAAIRAVLDPEGATLGPSDVGEGGDGTISIRLGLAGGEEATLEGTPEHHSLQRPTAAPPVLFLPAAERGTTLVAEGGGRGDGAERAREFLRRALAGGGGPSSTAPALALIDALESCCASGERGLVLLIEEPELYLRPQAQRYLYRLLLALSEAGNQVFYSTNSPAFLNVARLHELGLVTYDPERGTAVHQPEPLPATSEFRALSEFDAERSELLLARAALLVEGLTEKVVFPFVFRALGLDVDRLGISIVECGGKTNLALFARVCQASGIPCVAVHDSDAAPSGRVSHAHRVLNTQVAQLVGAERVVVLDPDFEGVAGLRGGGRKPEQARLAFIAGRDIPEPLRRAARLVASLARD